MNVYIAKRLSSPAQRATCALTLAPLTDRQTDSREGEQEAAGTAGPDWAEQMGHPL